MKKPALVILAAGLGSRFGGAKQTAAVDEFGHFIIDFSIYDAYKAGFDHVILVIRPQDEMTMREKLGNRVEKYMKVSYAHQRLEDLPEGYSLPEGRVKPWGTMHALLSARHLIDAPFAAINADDFYGRSSFEKMYHFLTTEAQPKRHCLVTFNIENTLTENGYTSRGICQKDSNGYLTEVVEHVEIYKAENGAVSIVDGEKVFIPAGTPVSMNFWGYSPDVLEEAWKEFPAFLDKNLKSNPLKCEYYLPYLSDILIHSEKATFQVIPTQEKWHGVTYADDLQNVVDAIRNMRDEKIYPNILFEQ